MDKSVSFFSCQTFSAFNIPKIIQIGLTELLKKFKDGLFWGTVYGICHHGGYRDDKAFQRRQL